MNIFTDIIWPCIGSVFNVLNKPLPLLGGLSLFIIIMAVFVMGIIINIVVAFVNNDFGERNLSDARDIAKENYHKKAIKDKRKSEKKWKKNGSQYGWL